MRAAPAFLRIDAKKGRQRDRALPPFGERGGTTSIFILKPNGEKGASYTRDARRRSLRLSSSFSARNT
jgi:hypothetical protein